MVWNPNDGPGLHLAVESRLVDASNAQLNATQDDFKIRVKKEQANADSYWIELRVIFSSQINQLKSNIEVK